MSQLVKAKVISNTQMAGGICKLVMDAPGVVQKTQPGQFLNIRVTGNTAPLLRRPISIHWAEGERVEILFQVVGQGTELLAHIRSGDILDVQGPLGRGFEPRDGKAVLVGGGIGIAPLAQLARSKDPGDVLCLLGAKNREALMASGGNKLAELGCELRVATDDGSMGEKGLVIQLLAGELLQGAVIYACGPKPMLRAVARLAMERQIPCQVSLEEHMGCGVGACLGCVCKTGNLEGGEYYKRVCSDGPVFSAGEVSWD